MFEYIRNHFLGREAKNQLKHEVCAMHKIKGVVILMKKNILDFNDPIASVLDCAHEFIGKRVSLQLIASNQENGSANIGKKAYLEEWTAKTTPFVAGETAYTITFDWDQSQGVPGAFIIENHHSSQFYLRTVTLEDVPGAGRIHFVCDSWVYPIHRYNYSRVFFSNKTYLPSNTPKSLIRYREKELENLRGNGAGELKEWDRVYDYAFYNDLGEPDKNHDHARPILGGSKKYPYPRRGRTGRPPTKTDPDTESRLPLLSLHFYVPRDECFGHKKLSAFLAYALKSVVQVIVSMIKEFRGKTPNEFNTFQEVLNLYEGGIQRPSVLFEKISNAVPVEMLKELIRSDVEPLHKFPTPQVIQDNKFNWKTDEEFAREMLAGVNPICIRLLQKFPPGSKLDTRKYGNQMSSITKQHIEKNLEGLSVEKALKRRKLFILDHHDTVMPYLKRINTEIPSTKIYATRTFLFLKDDSTLKPLAVELSLPHPDGEQYGAVSKIYTPAENGVKSSLWQLAKAYALVNDVGVHQLISHWLKTHAVIEPFVVATHRQLSVLHPIHKLLQPHFRDTMYINALARQILLNAGGISEKTIFAGRFAMEMSSAVYKDWVFTEQALPADLVKRGVAVPDSNQPCGVRLLIEDYPYAVDGLQIWSAIESWVEDYCSYYYPSDELLQRDIELQAWWKEIRTEGHGDKKDESWWPKMQRRDELIHSCTIIIWIASALHAAVNFGQYAYGGYLPNRPTISHRFIPEPGSVEYDELELNPELAYLKTITSQFQALLGVSLIEILSRHSSDTLYLGQRDTREWTSDEAPLEAFANFQDRLVRIERRILEMNSDEHCKNRVGPVKIPYTLLYPNTSDCTQTSGLTGRGIPNSTAI